MRAPVKKIDRILFVVLLIAVIYVAMVFHLPSNIGKKEFKKYYQNLMKAQPDEKTLEFFLSQKKSAQYLLEKLNEEKNIFAKRNALFLLSNLECSDCDNELLGYLNDPDYKVKIFAIDALENNGYEELLPLMYEIIENDSNDTVRKRCLLLIEKQGSAKDIVNLRYLLKEGKIKDQKMVDTIEVVINMMNKKLSQSEINTGNSLGE